MRVFSLAIRVLIKKSSICIEGFNKMAVLVNGAILNKMSIIENDNHECNLILHDINHLEGY